ncbi:UBA-like domain-containing protein 1 isoform 2-T2 [Anableps anableps]
MTQTAVCSHSRPASSSLFAPSCGSRKNTGSLLLSRNKTAAVQMGDVSLLMCTPANTPATPPNFPDALTMFSRLKASESFNSSAGGPVTASMATSPPPPSQVGGWGVSPNVPNVPQPQQGLWTQGQPPTQPCPPWPMAVNPHTGAEQKASVAMEAER